MLRLLNEAEVSRSLVAEGMLSKPRAIYPEPWRQPLVQPYAFSYCFPGGWGIFN